MEAVGATISSIVSSSLTSLGLYLPQFLAGLILLLIGLAVAAILKEVVLRFLKFLKVEEWLGNVAAWFNQLKSDKVKSTAWQKLLAELVRWTVVILFLVPAAEAWGLPRVSELLNSFLFYIPNVFVAIFITFVGIVVANLVSEIIHNTSRSLGGTSSSLLGAMAKYVIFFFTALVVLNQLGVASDLVRILFSGIVAMLAIAGGLAFGLGGQGLAKKVLEEFQNRLSGK